MKKRNLEILLQDIYGFGNPKAHLEQYPTPAHVAADILFLAYSLGDVQSKTVAELGAGPGIFTVGACALGADTIYSVEIDPETIEVLRENLRKNGCNRVRILQMNVSEFGISVHTVFQNAPFGSQTRHADMPFLVSALKNANVIYTLHNYATRDFLIEKIKELGGKITHTASFEFAIPHTFKFHNKEKVLRKFVFFRIECVRDSLK